MKNLQGIFTDIWGWFLVISFVLYSLSGIIIYILRKPKTNAAFMGNFKEDELLSPRLQSRLEKHFNNELKGMLETWQKWVWIYGSLDYYYDFWFTVITAIKRIRYLRYHSSN